MSVVAGLREPATLPHRILDWFVRDLHASWGLAIARIVFGFFTVALVVENWGVRNFFWGRGSSWAGPMRAEGAWNQPWFHFFDAGESSTVLSLKLAVLAFFGFCMMIGLFARPATIVVFFLMTSLIALNPVASDTEDVLFRIITFLLCFADTSQRLSVDHWIARRRGRLVDIGGVRTVRRGIIPMTVRIPVHNAAVCLIGGQIIALYVMAGYAKLSGPAWRDGSATYYPFHAEYLTPWPELSHHLGQWAPLVMLMTYASVIVQLLFPFMLLQRYTRIFIIIAMISLHIGIAVTLGLGLFSFAMCGADFVFIRDESVEKIKAWIRHRRGHEPAPERATRPPRVQAPA